MLRRTTDDNVLGSNAPLSQASPTAGVVLLAETCGRSNIRVYQQMCSLETNMFLEAYIQVHCALFQNDALTWKATWNYVAEFRYTKKTLGTERLINK